MFIEDDDGLIRMLDRGAGGCEQRPVLERIFETVAEYDTSFELINRYSNDNPHHALGFRAGQWFETTREVYWYFLECLPPLHMTGGGFVMSECTTGDLYESFMEIDGAVFLRCDPLGRAAIVRKALGSPCRGVGIMSFHCAHRGFAQAVNDPNWGYLGSGNVMSNTGIAKLLARFEPCMTAP